MATNRIKRIIGAVILCLQLSVLSIFAQSPGDIVSGTVNDTYGPVIGANVVELDGANRIVASTVTDINGNFSLKIVSPKNKLRFTYVGHKTVTQSINKLKYDIMMGDEEQLDEVVVLSKKRAGGSGLAIPVDEISTARESINMSEFEGLSITTVDEAL